MLLLLTTTANVSTAVSKRLTDAAYALHHYYTHTHFHDIISYFSTIKLSIKLLS